MTQQRFTVTFRGIDSKHMAAIVAAASVDKWSSVEAEIAIDPEPPPKIDIVVARGDVVAAFYSKPIEHATQCRDVVESILREEDATRARGAGVCKPFVFRDCNFGDASEEQIRAIVTKMFDEFAGTPPDPNVAPLAVAVAVS